MKQFPNDFFTEVFYVHTITMTMNKGQFSKTVITMVPGAAQTIIPAQTSISSICLLFQSRKMAAHSWNWSSLSRTKGRLYLSPWGNIQITKHNHYKTLPFYNRCRLWNVDSCDSFLMLLWQKGRNWRSRLLIKVF